MATQTGHHGLPSRPLSNLDLPPPPPPSEMPSMYRFGRDSWRPHDAYDSRGQHSEFSFRPGNGQGPHYPEDRARQMPSKHPTRVSHQRRQNGNAHTEIRDKRLDRRGNQYGRGRGRGSGFVAPAERPLLRSARCSTPEQMAGMAPEAKTKRKYLLPDDLSDSDEHEMEESEPEEGIGRPEQFEGESSAAALSVNEAPENASEPARKKQVRDLTEGNSAQALPAPRWSNPDPYTVLPPPDESQKKRKDMVKLIRKARIGTSEDPGATNLLAANDDFISLDVNQEPSSISSSDESEGEGRGVPGAPSGPRQFSHLDVLHGYAHPTAPGTIGVATSTTRLGPPPSYQPERPRDEVKAPHDSWPPPSREAALGNRKRTHNDVIKEEAPSRMKKKKGDKPALPDHFVVPEWQGNGTSSDTPWCSSDYSRVENIGYGLHQEICDFYYFVRPRHFEDRVRQELLQRLARVLMNEYGDCELHCFGSFAAGLYLPNADMDLVLNSRAFKNNHKKQVCQSRSQMHRLARFLQSNGVTDSGTIEVIAGAKVPLIKFVDRVTGLRVDLSFENDTGIVANQTFASWKTQFPAMPIIVTVIKQLLMMRGLNEVATGGLGGFSVTCLVTSLLQNMPEIQRGRLRPEDHLGVILMEFFNLYGNEFNTTITGIRMTPPYYFDKRRVQGKPYQVNKLHRLAIVDPNRSDNDISGGTSNILTIFELFADAYQALQRQMVVLSQGDFDRKDSRPTSILGTILGGNYASFEVQRSRLRHLYGSMS